MPEQWTAGLVGEMHQHQIKQTELAQELGMTPEYICAVLNGKRHPKNAEQRFKAALDLIVKKRLSDKIKTVNKKGTP